LPLSLRSLSRYSLFSSCRPIPISPSRRPAAFSSRRISLPLPRRPAAGHLARGCASARARASGTGRRLASTRHGGPGGRWRRARNPPPTDDWAGCRCYFGPFAGDEHHQVRPPLGLLFLLCETVRPSPNILFVFRSGGYGTVVLLHCRLHDPAGAEKVASGRKRERIKKTSWCM